LAKFVKEPAEPSRAAPSLAMAVRKAEPVEEPGPKAAPAQPAEATPAASLTCESCGTSVKAGAKRCPSCLRPLVSAEPAAAPSPGRIPCESCGEPVEVGWKRCPSCLRPLVSAEPAAAAPEPAREPSYERIPARPERDMGIRDTSVPERRERGRRETPLDPEKLAALREMIAREKAKGVDIGDIEAYLNSGVVTKEGLRIRLEAINEQSKRLEAGTGPAPETPDGGERPTSAPPGGAVDGSTPPAPAPERPAEAAPPGEGTPAEPESNGRQAGEPNGESRNGNGGQPGEGVRKIKKVKKVAK